jgi:hypothetical protein
MPAATVRSRHTNISFAMDSDDDEEDSYWRGNKLAFSANDKKVFKIEIIWSQVVYIAYEVV